MPINKNAYIRYRTLDRCFRDTRVYYSIKELTEKCSEELTLIAHNIEAGVSERQIYVDIKFMEDTRQGFGVKLKRFRDGGHKVYYRYEDPSFSISKKPLNKEEAKQLEQAVTTLMRFRGLPQYEWVEGAVNNLVQQFKLKGRSAPLVCFEQNQQLKGLEHLGTLIDAATDHKVLNIHYHSYNNGGRDIKFVFHTYHLKQFNNRWFAFGRNRDEQRITNIALDRIVSIEPNDNFDFVPNNDIDFDHYFDDIIGVSFPKNNEDRTPQKVIFRTTPKRYPYIESKPIHPSQRIEHRRNHMLRIDVIINDELKQRLLGFGPDIEVLEPASLREWMKEAVKETYLKYCSEQEE